MGSKQPFFWEIHRVLRDGRIELVSRGRSALAGRAGFWAIVDDEMDELRVTGRRLVLLHGAQVILEYPPREPAKPS